MRHTRSHTKNRRSHHALKGGAISPCPECGKEKIAHKVCMSCGMYRGRQVIGKKEIVAEKKGKEISDNKKTEAKKSK